MRHDLITWPRFFVFWTALGLSWLAGGSGRAEVGTASDGGALAPLPRPLMGQAAAGGETRRAALNRPHLAQGLETPGQDAPAGSFTLDPGDADWTLSIDKRAQIGIFHRGVQVVRCANNYWTKGSSWAMPSFSVASRTSDLVQIDGNVPGLGLKVRGLARPVSPRELRLDLEFVASQTHSGVTGGGITWNLKLDSPSFSGKADEPALLPDNTGWRWRVEGIRRSSCALTSRSRGSISNEISGARFALTSSATACSPAGFEFG